MNFLYVLSVIIGIYAVLCVIRFILITSTMFMNISMFFKEKTVKTIANRKALDIQNLSNQLKFEDDFLTMIDGIVKEEALHILEVNAVTKEKYNVLNLDTDIKLIANNVYESINKDLYENELHILTADYLLKYISSKARSVMMASMPSLTSIV